MKFSSKRLSQTITQLCLAKEIDHIVISPGSRNAPLTIGFTEHPGFHNFSLVDERCAAFFALGMAQQLRCPVVLVCTSGSALLNYYPAVAEAYYSDIPLIVISADRPEELVEIGDGQTIKQENVFANHILYSANCREGEEHQIQNETIINVALNTAIELNGPVHINAPFSEPLYERLEDLKVRPQHVPARVEPETIPENIDELQRHWDSAEKIMVLTGVMAPNTVEDIWIEQLANNPKVIVLTETTSNIHSDRFFPAIDQLITDLTEEQRLDLQPDLLVTFGGMVISKRIKAFLRKYKPKYHWHVDKKKAYDTYFSLSQHIRNSPNFFLKNILSKTELQKSRYSSNWQKIKKEKLDRQREFLLSASYSDLQAYNIIFRSLPETAQLQIANSAAIRYAQLFQLGKGQEVYCNRGTSGIDGSTSTAIGAARVNQKATVLITGDLSFFYDSNAFWNNYIPSSFRVILVNNAGGGIFRILPGAKKTEHFKTFFETHHGLTAKKLCELYGVDYTSAGDETELVSELDSFFNQSKDARLLEVFTPSELNDKILYDYFDAIR